MHAARIDTLLTPAAAAMAASQGHTAIKPHNENLTEVVTHLGTPLPQDTPVHLLARAQPYGAATEVSYRTAKKDAVYVPGDSIGQADPTLVPKAQLRGHLILEGVIRRDWDDPAFTESVAYNMQEPLRLRNRRQAIMHAAGSLILMFGSVVSGTLMAKHTGDPGLARTTTLAGIGIGMLYGLGMAVVRPAWQTIARQKRRSAIRHLPLLIAENNGSAA